MAQVQHAQVLSGVAGRGWQFGITPRSGRSNFSAGRALGPLWGRLAGLAPRGIEHDRVVCLSPYLHLAIRRRARVGR